ncbi:hypothetical protein GQ43DRAFT_430082 [Delitschia confertaspora ATCC 74209]|uniref:Uncharacterized protein n=1 Tax=Delitschia confertaspora ATCC 74209 TaxID=1513339 RepID=A0A9P4MU32_9PLEO|nr:hypothetical protein GQ43DRAFT_430082 [Delitschia confertaspora ATCC 74209]
MFTEGDNGHLGSGKERHLARMLPPFTIMTFHTNFLEVLPGELITEICGYLDSAEDWFTSSFTLRKLCDKSFYAFAKRFFAVVKIQLQPYSLRVFLNISLHPEFTNHVRFVNIVIGSAASHRRNYPNQRHSHPQNTELSSNLRYPVPLPRPPHLSRLLRPPTPHHPLLSPRYLRARAPWLPALSLTNQKPSNTLASSKSPSSISIITGPSGGSWRDADYAHCTNKKLALAAYWKGKQVGIGLAWLELMYQSLNDRIVKTDDGVK